MLCNFRDSKAAETEWTGNKTEAMCELNGKDNKQKGKEGERIGNKVVIGKKEAR